MISGYDHAEQHPTPACSFTEISECPPSTQAEAAYAQGKDKAAGAADYAKQTAQQAADATYDAAGQAKEQVPCQPIRRLKLHMFLHRMCMPVM
jgi:hypothetical protein